MAVEHLGTFQAYEEIVPLSMPDWDTIARSYKTKHLYHEVCWLRFLEQSQGVKIVGMKLLDAGGTVAGYFCAGEVRKGPFRLLGSPLQGWTTAYMGPLVNELHPESFLAVLERYCRAQRVDYIEIANPALPAAVMQAAGYELDPDITYLVTIDEEAAMWARLKSECRNRIRRGMKNELRVERTTDRAFIGQFYAQLQDVFLRQGRVPTYGLDRVQALWDALMPEGKLLALRVWRGDELVATGVFPHDERAIFFWGGATWTRLYSLYPNELLHWSAMVYALERKIPIYNMSGGGSFKPKFGGTEVRVERWFKPTSSFARVGRWAYREYTGRKNRLLGLVRQKFGTSPVPGAESSQAVGPEGTTE